MSVNHNASGNSSPDTEENKLGFSVYIISGVSPCQTRACSPPRARQARATINTSRLVNNVFSLQDARSELIRNTVNFLRVLLFTDVPVCCNFRRAPVPLNIPATAEEGGAYVSELANYPK
ncbi:hypothetical protein BaRGS_00012933 [Batillaria attramentaria]|uniref:Uncharacterized protein n=1 Tax=Batillaria attramentaria TaxID=370345 RepID=A0ABD0L9S2_9CAEN